MDNSSDSEINFRLKKKEEKNDLSLEKQLKLIELIQEFEENLRTEVNPKRNLEIKLEISKLKEEIKLEISKSKEEINSETETIKQNEVLKFVVGSFSLLSFYILIVGIPVATVWILNVSSLVIIYVALSATLLSILIFGSLMGKVSWGMFILVSTSSVGIGILLFFFLTNYA